MEPTLLQLFFTMNNKHRIRIYSLCLDNRLNITQLKKKLNISYQHVLNHLNVLEENGLIKRTRHINKKFLEVLVESIPLNKNSLGYRLLREIKKEIRYADKTLSKIQRTNSNYN